MTDIIIIGSINMNLVAHVVEIPKKGETVIGTSFNQIPGGEGTKQAISMAKLKGNVAMIGKIGNDNFGDMLLSSMNSNGVNTYYIEKTEEAPTGVALISIDGKGEKSIIIASGANFKINTTNIDKAENLIEQSNIVVMQLDIPIETVEYGLKKAKKKGKYTILNPVPAQVLDREIIENVDLLTPNELELEFLSGIPIRNEEDIKKSAKILLGQGVKELIVTLKNKKCIYISPTKFKKYNTYIDTENRFNSALIVKLSQGKNIDEAINFALMGN